MRRSSTRAKAKIFNACIDALIEDENIDILGLRLPLPRLREDQDVVNRFADIVKAGEKTDKLLIVFSRASVSLPEYWRQLLRAHQIPFLLEYRKGFKALKSLLNYRHFLERRGTATQSRTRVEADLSKVRILLHCRRSNTDRATEQTNPRRIWNSSRAGIPRGQCRRSRRHRKPDRLSGRAENRVARDRA